MIKKKRFLLDEIMEIKSMGRKQCYDLTIPKNHNFFANGILVHNTGFLEESADQVLLLFWENFYNADKDINLFKIIVAKNRNGVTGYHFLNYFPQFYKFKELTLTQRENFKKKKEFKEKLKDSFDAREI